MNFKLTDQGEQLIFGSELDEIPQACLAAPQFQQFFGLDFPLVISLLEMAGESGSLGV